MGSIISGYAKHDSGLTHDSGISRLSSRLRNGEDGAYVGFLADEGEEWLRQAYPMATRERLAEVKARYNPSNLFRLNHNIPPAR
ncbi:MAG: BBE domain-containing protein, partial [Actinobacteria bacterium]|nr:BBE domain-containing protein [Actinomycetota bacterium]